VHNPPETQESPCRLLSVKAAGALPRLFRFYLWREWRNSRRSRLKICRINLREGASPSSRTNFRDIDNVPECSVPSGDNDIWIIGVVNSVPSYNVHVFLDTANVDSKHILTTTVSIKMKNLVSRLLGEGAGQPGYDVPPSGDNSENLSPEVRAKLRSIAIELADSCRENIAQNLFDNGLDVEEGNLEAMESLLREMVSKAIKFGPEGLDDKEGFEGEAPELRSRANEFGEEPEGGWDRKFGPTGGPSSDLGLNDGD
jgi:hypothetical protein